MLFRSAQNQTFQQALQKSQSQIQRQQAAQQLQAAWAQLGAGSLASLQQAQQPVLQAFYKQPILQNITPQAQAMAISGQQMAGPSLFQPESSMAFQSSFLPYQAGVALQAAQIQANAAKSASQNSMLGSLGGSALGLLGNSGNLGSMVGAVGSLGSSLIGGGGTLLAGVDRKSTRLNSSHSQQSRMPSSA